MAATIAISRPVVAPTATPAVCEVVSGGEPPAAAVWLGLLVDTWREADVFVSPVPTASVVAAREDSDADVKLWVAESTPETLDDVMEAKAPAVVEWAIIDSEDVCRASACVALTLVADTEAVPMGSIE